MFVCVRGERGRERVREREREGAEAGARQRDREHVCECLAILFSICIGNSNCKLQGDNGP